MRVRNVSGRPIEVDRGRIVDRSAVAEVNSRDPQVAAALEAGRLKRMPPPPSTGPAEVQEDEL